MGVHGLWELLAPVGRRVSVETLSGKKLAIDASIWMVQFMKAMRDEKGEMVRNAHLLGFFRRICKLMFLRTKPVFVFDGGTPALKRRTVIARRRQRENAQAKVRKTAEKLLLNHLKSLKLKELANDIKNQRPKKKSEHKGPKNSDQMAGSDLGRSNLKELDETSAAKVAAEDDKFLSQMASRSDNQVELDEMLAASMAAEEDGTLASKGVASDAFSISEEEGSADEEMMLPAFNAEVDPAVFAVLPPSIQLDILAQLKGKNSEGLRKDVDNPKQHEVNDLGKGKGILSGEINMVGCSSRSDGARSTSYNQDKVDEMLAASIAAEENEDLVNNASTSAGTFISEEEDANYDDDEEMILPAMHGEVDPAVLASLPPSMQLDLLVQMRERLIAENRQKYQKVKKDPAKFSELQIQAYLKTVSFRREIDQVQKAAVGVGVGGVQSSRIASEANREYIFSSSFTGDKQELTSTGLEKNKDTQDKTLGKHASQDFMNSIPPANDSNTSSGMACNEPGGAFDESIQTYLDEKGRFRVSRLRALGMRMTRDIQRNLDLMKEIEQEKADVNKSGNFKSVLDAEKNGTIGSSSNQFDDISNDIDVDLAGENRRKEHLMLERDTSMEISFECDANNKCLDADDVFFASLVAGNSGKIPCAVNSESKERPSDSNSDFDWEEGIIEDKSNILGDVKVDKKPSSVAKEDNSDESEVEWEEGVFDGAKSTLSCQAESAKAASRGCLEEEGDLQEAIKRSLESIGPLGDEELKYTSSLDEHSNAYQVKQDHALNCDDNMNGSGVRIFNGNVGVLNRGNSIVESSLVRDDGMEENGSFDRIVERFEKLDSVSRNNPQTSHFPGRRSELSVSYNSDKMGILINKPCMTDKSSHFEDSLSDPNERTKDEVHKVAEQFLDTCNEVGKVSCYCNKSSKVVSLDATKEEKKNVNNEAEPLGNFTEMTKPADSLAESSLKESTKVLNTEKMLPTEDNDGTDHEERKINLGNDAVEAPGDLHEGVDEVSLEMTKPAASLAESFLKESTEVLDTEQMLPTGNNDGTDHEEKKINLGKDAVEAPGDLHEGVDEVSLEMTKPAASLAESSLKESTEVFDNEKMFPSEDNDGSFHEERKINLGKDTVEAPGDWPEGVDEVSLEEEMRILGQEYANLENEQRKLERNAESVNSELFTECQELLQMFGLPYIIAPMEAEAQCAYLEAAKLVDGVVTDDSDVLLFGARSVYKNIFDDRKYVETYFMEDVEKELGLTREKIVRMALLLGSDYTEGVSGIGIVNAIEVLNAFPEEDGLVKFRQWVESPDPTILGRFDAKSGSSSRKRGSKVEGNINGLSCNMEETVSNHNVSHPQDQMESSDYIQEIKQNFMDKHRNVSKNWHIPSSFPSETVVSAYSSPQVDKSTEPFAWGKPDHLVLRRLCCEKFGWTSQKADELLLPVLKEYNKHETQLRLEAFYTFNERFAKIRSKRIKKAVKEITGNHPSDMIDDSGGNFSNKSEKGSPVEPVENKLKTSKGMVESLSGKKKSERNQSIKRKNARDTVAKMQSRKKRNINCPDSDSGLEVENLGPYMQTGEEKSDGKALSYNRSGGGKGRRRGSGRGRGRGRGVGVNKGRVKESLGFESHETTSSSSGSEDHEQSEHVKNSIGTHKLRRSLRSRKQVNYSMKELEIDDADDSFDQSSKTCLHEKSIEENSSCIHGAFEDIATGFSREKESDAIFHPLKEDLSRDCFESGVGFSTEEGETGRPVANSNHDNSFDAGFAKNYLKLGGGFCIDDSETGNDHKAFHDVTEATVEDSADLPYLFGSANEADFNKSSLDKLSSGVERAENDPQDGGSACAYNMELNLDNISARCNNDRSDVAVLMPENALDKTESSAGAFSAMPFLRKKRRKS